MAKISGSFWVDANTLHYADVSGNSWYFTGTVGSTPAGAIAGSVWIDQSDATIHYIDSGGRDRSIAAGTVTSRSGVGAIKGSMWVESTANANYSLHFIDNSQNERYCHSDVAHVDGGSTAHTDSHSDGHSDVPDSHGDAYANYYGDMAHDDWFGDGSPHGDFHSDSAHGDGYANYGSYHSDSHGDAHSDTHTDSHSDVTHVDQPTNEGP